MSAVHPAVLAARNIAREVAAPAADDVDKHARFPTECMDAQKKEKLLGAFVPKELGGLGLGMAELTQICESLGGACAASGLITSMHHIQVACIVRHGIEVPAFRKYLEEIAKEQRLIASVTSEVGIGGDMRSSIAAVERHADGTFTLDKDATTISYGEQADDLLVSSRRDTGSPASDQVLVLVKRGQFTLEKKSTWDTLGMRGTCSPAFMMRSKGPADQIMPLAFGDIASRTMVPFSHILWAGAWVGMATAAVSRARAYVRGEARKKPGTTPACAMRLAEVMNLLQLMRNNVHDVAAECDRHLRDEVDRKGDQLLSIGFAIKMNNLKLGTSKLLAQIVQECLLIVGLGGYKNDGKFAMGRLLRDSLAAQIMINNDRVVATNAALLLVLKDD